MQTQAHVTLGFTTSPGPQSSSFAISDLGGSLRNLDFGNLSITIADDSGTTISELIGAQIVIGSALIDLSTENLIATFGMTSIYSYDLTAATSVNGFSIVLGGNTILEADLYFNSLVTVGKSGSIDPEINYSFGNVALNTTGLTAGTIAYLSQYISGADMVLSLASDSLNMYAGLHGTQTFHGVVGGTAAPIPEPFMYLFMGWGVVMLYTVRKVNSKCK
jgi:hypothetical protein